MSLFTVGEFRRVRSGEKYGRAAGVKQSSGGRQLVSRSSRCWVPSSASEPVAAAVPFAVILIYYHPHVKLEKFFLVCC